MSTFTMSWSDPGTLVDILLAKGGNFLNVYFLYFDDPSNCPYFLQIGQPL
ncbi:hypothetical protein [Lysinibacillus sp. NPDC047702]